MKHMSKISTMNQPQIVGFFGYNGQDDKAWANIEDGFPLGLS